ncbi:MAG: C_GCAxxG_C_C family protein [Deltaproteobacteria bacterium]|nr:C_GCAxxG_C_C family protein [Deltaproteobacteria bacterium]
MAESKGIHSDLIPKIATGFCSGVSRTCGMCGAVIGAIMALNLFYGRNLSSESLETSYIVVRKLLDMFESRFGTTNCKQLIGCDLGTKEGQNTFESNNLIEQCRIFTEEATGMVMLIIEEKYQSNQ